nr:rhodanese-like domain-containing protein [Candidatus Accumulibacter sp. ACC003]
MYDTTLAGMAFERMGHMNYAVMNGGYVKWVQAGRPADTTLPGVSNSKYPLQTNADNFTVDFQTVVTQLGKPGVVIIDVRPTDYYTGKKSDEARAGHIPGAISRPFTEDLVIGSNKAVSFKSTAALTAAYSEIIPSKDTMVIVYCRTGHQASQTYFRFPDLGGNRVGTSDKSEGHSCPGFRMRKILQGEFLEERGDSAIMSWAGHPVNFDGQGVG